ncbi:hypothetical protein [Mogibacterium neglectum]|uniref:hypothetical protein n=1 Tax=Mogibacterium neglectum TaxID=114528 RepID=UPI002ED61E0B
MRNSLRDRPNGYIESIEIGQAVMSYLKGQMVYGEGSILERSAKLVAAIEASDTVIIGAGAGLSTSAGFTYSGERFERYFLTLQRSME